MPQRAVAIGAPGSVGTGGAGSAPRGDSSVGGAGAGVLQPQGGSGTPSTGGAAVLDEQLPDDNVAADGHAVDGAAPAAAAPVEGGLQEEPMRFETDQDAIIKQLSDRLAARRRVDTVNDAVPLEAEVEDSEGDVGEHSGVELPSSGSEAGDVA